MLKLILVPFVALCVCLAIATSQGQTQQSKSESAQQHTGREQRGPEKLPFIIEMLPTEQTKQESGANQKEGQSQKNEGWSLSDKIAAIASVVGFGQFLALACTIGVMMLTARKQLRAYFHIDGIVVGNIASPPPPQPGQELVPTVARIHRPLDGPIINIGMKNFGQTPARDVTFWIRALIREFPLTGPLPGPEISNAPSRMMIPPTGIFETGLVLSKPLAPNEIAEISAIPPTKAIYIYGEINYRNVHSRACWTRFRYFHNSFTGIVGITTAATAYPEGNEADRAN